ncbi:uncharacterized protein NPIL_316481 [Nephila pilipes]|uniref:Uncharacterized protein n=1 Tax=Nephila pilipes TaxID=299642 RepID=A0A8X6UFD4_NEPPI|nr:uncharacterized protein NPIL_316481 [Nephila pilipes]
MEAINILIEFLSNKIHATFIPFIFLYNQLTFASRVISSEPKECDPGARRCLLSSSNLQKRAKTREINTWYPIPRHRILFDTRKNSRGGRFASNFNKPDPTRADGYPHANDFPRSPKKGKIAEEFGIRFGSLTDDKSRMEEERLAKWNDTAGGEEALFVLSPAKEKSNAALGLEGRYHVNNSSVKINNAGKNDVGEELVGKVEILGDSVSPNTFNGSYSLIKILNVENQQVEKNDYSNASFPTEMSLNSRKIRITNNSESGIYFSSINIPTEDDESKIQHSKGVKSFPSDEDIDIDVVDSNKEVELTENYNSELNNTNYRNIASIDSYRTLKIDGFPIPLIVATLHLKNEDKNKIGRQYPELIIFRATNGLKDSRVSQNRRKRSRDYLETYSSQDICKKLKCLITNYSNLASPKRPNEITLGETLKKSSSTDVLKIFNIRNVPKLKSNETRNRFRNKIWNHNKRSARGISTGTSKFYQRSDGADLSSEHFTMLRISDNASVVGESSESYQTGTLVRGRVPLLSNELPRKNNSVSDEGRKKSELQIYKEDSLDKDLGASKIETGIGDQLRNDVKEGEPKREQYIYIRLRNLHSSLRESGNKKIQQFLKETSFESSGGSDLRMHVLRMYKPNDFRTVSSMGKNGTIKLDVNDDWKLQRKIRSVIGKVGSKWNSEMDNEIFSPLRNLEKKSGRLKNTKRYTLQKTRILNRNAITLRHRNGNYQLNESSDHKPFGYMHSINRLLNETKNRNNMHENMSNSKKNNESSNKNKALISLIKNASLLNKVSKNRLKRQITVENNENKFKSSKIHIFHRRNNANFGHLLGFLIEEQIPKISIGEKNGDVESMRNQSLNLFDSYNNNEKIDDRLRRSNKIRGLFKTARRRTDRLNKLRIIGRAARASPKKNLTFSSYSRNTEQSVSRPITRLTDWIRTNIYKEKVSLRTPKALQNIPEPQEEDPKLILLLVLPSEESSISESSNVNGRAESFPDRKIKKSQIESEDEDDDELLMTTSNDSEIKPRQKDSKSRNKPNIGEQYARFVDNEHANSDSENESRNGIEDWLNSQWVYINSINVNNDQFSTTEIPSSLTTEVIPSITRIPEHTTLSVLSRAAQTRAPLPNITTRTPNRTITTRAPTSVPNSNLTANSNDTVTTLKPESIQNMPTTIDPWDIPHKPWEMPWYDPWEETKRPWNLPVNPWQVTQRPWNKPINPWKVTQKPWNPPSNTWEATRRPWNPPSNTWETTRRPWIPPVDPWEKEQPWNPPVDPWEKRPWNPPNDLWQEDKKPWNNPVDPWEMTKKPWIPPNNVWQVTKRPWTPPSDPWQMNERPVTIPVRSWRVPPKPWNLPDNQRKMTRRPWNPSYPWQTAKSLNPPHNLRKLIKSNRGFTSDPWKMNIPWWDCGEWLLPYEA